MAVRELLLVGLGGAAGSMLRYLASGFVQRLSPLALPVGTLAVNVTGSLLIGLIAALAEQRQVGDSWRLFLVVGVLGGYTTFSAFSLEFLVLTRAGQLPEAFVYAALQVTLSIGAALAGFMAARLL